MSQIWYWDYYYTSLSSSLLESSTLPSGSGMPPQRLRSPCGTRIRRMRTHRTDHNMPRRWRPPVKSCSVLRSARSSCAPSSRPRRLISPHWSKDVWMSQHCTLWRLSVTVLPPVVWMYSPIKSFLFALLSRMNSDTVDYDDSCLIVRYLASMRPFAQSFDIYLTQVRFKYSNQKCLLSF